MSSPKKQKFCDFSTASEFMNGSNATTTVDGGVTNTTTNNDEHRQEVSNGSNNTFMEAREIISSGGFSTAKEFMESIPTKSEETTAPLLQPGQSSFDVLLKVRGLQYHKENLESLESLSLHRDVKNLYGKFVVLYTYYVKLISYLIIGLICLLRCKRYCRAKCKRRHCWAYC